MTPTPDAVFTRRRFNVKVPMRDGVELAADVYLPKADAAATAVPVLLARTPYIRQSPRLTARARWFADRGYAVVTQDVRGRGDSGGTFAPFRHEGPDGFDTVAWIAAQPWCGGNVGMFGGSYGAWVQWAAARERPPALKALVSAASPGRWMSEGPYRNGLVSLEAFGALNLMGARSLHFGQLINWRRVLAHLPLRTMDAELGRSLPAWQEWLDHPTLDEYWSALLLTAADYARIDLPVLHLTGWFDGEQAGALHHYAGMTAHSPAARRQRLIIGPWDRVGTRAPCEELDDVHKKWFDRWLGGVEATDGVDGRCSIFVGGRDEWIETPTWPPADIRAESWHLDGDGTGAGRLSATPPAVDGADTYRYDPDDPVISHLDWDFHGHVAVPTKPLVDTPRDRRPVECRPDVLVYTTPALAAPLTVTGQPVLVFHASSDSPDTDWVVHLGDVHPGGPSLDLASGVLRARFRQGLDREEPLTPGEIYRFRVELGHVGHEFGVGHAIRISITSSEFPRYDRNPNTGAPIGADAEPRIAQHGSPRTDTCFGPRTPDRHRMIRDGH